MAVGAFIVVRLSSSRLPAKGIKKILDKPMIELMVERIQNSKLIDKIVIATSHLSSDDPLEDLAKKLGIGCYRGSLEHIMERILSASKTNNCDTIVELLGDNPLVHSDLIDDVISCYFSEKCDYSATLTKEHPLAETDLKRFSAGVRVQIYSQSVAEKYVLYPEYINNENKHPCAYIFDHPEKFKIKFFEAANKWGFLNRPELNFAVNYRKNYELIRTVFEHLYPGTNNFSLKQVCDLLDEHRYLYLQMGN